MRIALAGNPNSGKTTLFNALTGSNQFVGNWPGVTVEKKEGRLKGQKDIIITDLPGIYSLSPYTLEEVVARNYLVNERPDALLNIIDGTNLERNLYLTTQLRELDIPMVVAINMADIVEKNGDKLNLSSLTDALGCPVFEISALTGIGIEQAIYAAIEAAKKGDSVLHHHSFSKEVETVVSYIEDATQHIVLDEHLRPLHRWVSMKLLERDKNVLEQLSLTPELAASIEKRIEAYERAMGNDAESLIASERYNWIADIINSCWITKHKRKLSTSDKIDLVVTNRWMALPIFAAVMFIVYYVSVTTVGAWVTDWTNDTLFGEWVLPTAAAWLTAVNCAPWLQGLLVDGILSGVGAVLGFVPQMFVLFAFLAFLEACGYMARIAFIMDRIFRRFGLSGKSFIPMLIGSGCGVPGIMASRTIENDRDRKMTIITTTFVPCGAKLPIIALIAGALFSGAWWVAPSAYFVGIAAIVCSGIILKKTALFAGDPAPFVMELPAYHMPTIGNVLRSMWERGWSFIKKAGTIIMLSTILVWFTSFFGWVDGHFTMLEAEQLDHSILALIGTKVAGIFAPLGWGDWRATVAAVTGLVAKENVVGTFGILYGFSEVAEDGAEVWEQLQASFTPLAAYSFLVFNLLCAPCFAAMGAIKREMNNTKWFLFAVGYQTILAWCVSLCIYQFGSFYFNRTITSWTYVAGLLLLMFLWLLVRPQREDGVRQGLLQSTARRG